MKLRNRKGEEVVVTFDREFAKVGNVVVMAIRDNKVRTWNDLLLDQPSLNAVKIELSKQIKQVELGKKKK